MLINSAQKMPSIESWISIGFRNPAHQLSANILGSYLWRYLYLRSVSREELFDNIMQIRQASVKTVHILRNVSCVLVGNKQYTNGI